MTASSVRNRPARTVRARIQRTPVDGLIIVPGTQHRVCCGHQAGVPPVFLLDRPATGIDADHDPGGHFDGARRCVAHLLRAGHSRSIYRRHSGNTSPPPNGGVVTVRHLAKAACRRPGPWHLSRRPMRGASRLTELKPSPPATAFFHRTAASHHVPVGHPEPRTAAPGWPLTIFELATFCRPGFTVWPGTRPAW